MSILNEIFQEIHDYYEISECKKIVLDEISEELVKEAITKAINYKRC